MLHGHTLSITLSLSTVLLCQHQSLSPLTTTISFLDHSYLSYHCHFAITIILVPPFCYHYQPCSPLLSTVASVHHCTFAPPPSPCNPLVHDPRCSPLLWRSLLPRQLCFVMDSSVFVMGLWRCTRRAISGNSRTRPLRHLFKVSCQALGARVKSGPRALEKGRLGWSPQTQGGWAWTTAASSFHSRVHKARIRKMDFSGYSCFCL